METRDKIEVCSFLTGIGGKARVWLADNYVCFDLHHDGRQRLAAPYVM